MTDDTPQNPLTQTWTSGDWKETPNKEAPYNGIKISGTPIYDDQNKFVSANIVFTDCTLVENGIEGVTQGLTLIQKEVPIIPPMNPTSPPSSPPILGENFTIDGWVELDVSGTTAYLRIRLTYGALHFKRQELGFVMAFDLIKISEQS